MSPHAKRRERLDPPVRTEHIYDGEVVNLRVSDYRRPDGTEVRREVMDHAGAVVMVPLADDHILLVRQPREAIERLTLELPAGKLDVPGEPPLECAKRELGEEVGREAATWRALGGFYMSPAILTEYIHLFVASDLTAVPATAPPEECLEVVRWPLADLSALIERIEDAKSLIGLLRLQRELRPGGPLAADAPAPARLRAAMPADEGFLAEMCRLADAWRPGTEPPPLARLRDDPTEAAYFSGWGRPGDDGIVAERDGAPVGAAWLRLFIADRPGYGYVDARTPELAIALAPGVRGDGLGTALLTELLRRAELAGHPALSLSVADGNPARRLYERLGFHPVAERDGAATMVRPLGDARGPARTPG